MFQTRLIQTRQPLSSMRELPARTKLAPDLRTTAAVIAGFAEATVVEIPLDDGELLLLRP
ncbi:hypothetical protein GCM10023217_33710 [Gordonia alkaliphila]|uniref:Uncharacterized protein n=1 Tax=Gordonia alkaliphila TaxID=1053547 RepID=A0ABP8ZKC4_9ACTN